MVKIKFSFLTLLFFSTISWSQTVVYTGYGSAAYPKSHNIKYFNLIQSLGFGKIDILYTCYVDNERDSNVSCQSNDTPKLSRLADVIKEARKRSLQVTLRAYIDLRNNKWRAYWDPNDKKKAFLGILNQLMELAHFAAKNKVEELLIGSEYEKLTGVQNLSYWKDIIGKLRKIYNGKLLYAANGNLNNSEKAEYEKVSFWSLIDDVGINYYPSFKGEASFKSLQDHHLSTLRKYQKFAKENKMNLRITEVGFPLALDGLKSPYEWRYKKGIGSNVNERGLSANLFSKMAQKLNIDELHYWRYLFNEEEIHPMGYVWEEKLIEALKSEPSKTLGTKKNLKN